MQTTEIVYNRTGQSVEFYPPQAAQEALGVPSSVTASVYDGARSNDDTADFAPTVTVDSVDTTVDVACGQTNTPSNRRKIPLAATTSIVAGRLYLLDSGNGSHREVVEVAKISSGDHVESVTELAYDYAVTASTFKGLRCTFPVDATWVTTESNVLRPTQASYRVRWQYTVGGTVYNYETYLRLVRNPFGHTLTPQDLMASWPGIFQRETRDGRGEKFKRLLASAEDRVRADVLAEGYRPEQIKDTEVRDRLVLLAFEYELGRKVGPPEGRDQADFVREAAQEYGVLFGKTISTLRLALDSSVEGAINEKPIQRYFFER